MIQQLYNNDQNKRFCEYDILNPQSVNTFKALSNKKIICHLIEVVSLSRGPQFKVGKDDFPYM